MRFIKDFFTSKDALFGLFFLVLGAVGSYAFFFWSDRLSETTTRNEAEFGDLDSHERGVRYRLSNSIVWRDMPPRQTKRVRVGDAVFTAADITAKLTLLDGTQFEIEPNSLVVFKAPPPRRKDDPIDLPKQVIAVKKGTLRIKNRSLESAPILVEAKGKTYQVPKSVSALESVRVEISEASEPSMVAIDTKTQEEVRSALSEMKPLETIEVPLTTAKSAPPPAVEPEPVDDPSEPRFDPTALFEQEASRTPAETHAEVRIPLEIVHNPSLSEPLAAALPPEDKASERELAKIAELAREKREAELARQKEEREFARIAAETEREEAIARERKAQEEREKAERERLAEERKARERAMEKERLALEAAERDRLEQLERDQRELQAKADEAERDRLDAEKRALEEQEKARMTLEEQKEALARAERERLEELERKREEEEQARLEAEAEAEAEKGPDTRVAFSLGAKADFFQITSTDKQNGGTASILSELSPALAFGAKFTRSPRLSYGIDFEAQKYSLQPLSAGRHYTEDGGTRFKLGLSGTWRLGDRVSGTLGLGARQELFLFAPNATEISLEKAMILSPTVGLKIQTWRSRSSTFDLFASGSLLAPAKTPSIKVSSGFGYALGGELNLAPTFMRKDGSGTYQKSGWALSLQYEGASQKTSFADQTQKNLSIGLKYHWGAR